MKKNTIFAFGLFMVSGVAAMEEDTYSPEFYNDTNSSVTINVEGPNRYVSTITYILTKGTSHPITLSTKKRFNLELTSSESLPFNLPYLPFANPNLSDQRKKSGCIAVSSFLQKKSETVIALDESPVWFRKSFTLS